MNYRIMLLTMAGLLAVSSLSRSSPITDDYQTGDTLTATMLNNIKDAVNDNDTRMDNAATTLGDHGMRLNSIESAVSDNESRVSALEGGAEVTVDCSADVNAFRNTALQDRTTYVLTGMCDGPIWIEGHSGVTIKGDATGSKDDGVRLPAGLVEQPHAAIGIWQSNAVVLDNLTVSAANYVSASYVFGEHVSALHVGNKSFAEASSVDFVGGDYSVHVYNSGMLMLRAGNTVSGFNLGGLTAYNQGLIVTLEDINVSGLVGASTSETSTALLASNNAVIDIRNGGSFAGPTVSGGQDYRTTVRAADNGTVRIQNASNPTQITGGVEASRSAVTYIEGNATVTGYIGAYHMAYTRVVGTVQSGGLVEAGDGGFLRFDSSSLSPTSLLFPATPVDLYRMGKLRVVDTTMNLGGADLSVTGFAYINLRGSTDLGGAGIDCQSADLIFIQGTVTNVGVRTC